MNRPPRRLDLLSLLAIGILAHAAAAQNPPVDREKMWPAPTQEDWEKPCLITWQRTWEDARALSKETGRPILVCVNMDGEIASEHYAGVRYRQPDIAKLYEPYVTVIASVYRHTPRDYDEQGRRILCPRFGSVTCGEHIAIEPILYEKFMDGRRIAPRHIMVELDGQETYDVMLTWDTASVFKAIRDGIANRKHQPEPVVRGDRTILERVASPDIVDRIAVEKAYQEGDRAMQRSLLEAALALGDKAPVELLRLGVFGFDTELSRLARKALAKSGAQGTVDVIAEALRVPMEAPERDALVAALTRLGKDSPQARTLAAVHKGLSSGKRSVDTRGWSQAMGATYEPAPEPDRSEIAARLGKMQEVFTSDDPDAHLELAETFLDRALHPDNEQDSTRLMQRALFSDAKDAAEKAETLGAKGWRVNAALAVAHYYLDEVDAAYRRAEAAMKAMPDEPTDWSTMVVLGLFAESRRKAIQAAVEGGKQWPGEWLTDLHDTYELLARHPHGDDSQVCMHYDFLRWLGAGAQAASALDEGLKRFPASRALHARLRRSILHRKGIRGLETVYDAMLGKDDADASLPLCAGYASLVAAEFHRRRRRDESALASYDRAIKLYERAIETDPENRAAADHDISLALAGRARIAFEQESYEQAVDEVIASFDRSPASAATLDGLNISAVGTAKALLARLKEKKLDDLAAKVDAALGKLDPELLKLPAFENVGGAPRRGQGRRPRRPRDG